MKVSHSIAALVAPAMVLAAPVGKYRAGQNEPVVTGLVSPPLPIGSKSPLPLETRPGPVIPEVGLPIPANEDLQPTNASPGNIVNMPGPVVPADNLPEVTQSETRPWKEEKRSDEILLSPSDSIVTALHCTDVEDVESCEIWTGLGERDGDEVLDLLHKVTHGASEQSIGAIIEDARERHGDEYADWLRRISGGSKSDTTGRTRKEEKRSGDVVLERPILTAPQRLPFPDSKATELRDWLNKTNLDIYKPSVDDMRSTWEDVRMEHEEWYAEWLRSMTGGNKGETKVVDYYCVHFSGTQECHHEIFDPEHESLPEMED